MSLLAVSKTFPADGVLALAALGQRRFGENYLQEALDKIAECAARAPDVPLEWHFIGPIQSNKTRPIAEHFDWVHSVDRERIARRLAADPGELEALRALTGRHLLHTPLMDEAAFAADLSVLLRQAWRAWGA